MSLQDRMLALLREILEHDEGAMKEIAAMGVDTPPEAVELTGRIRAIVAEASGPAAVVRAAAIRWPQSQEVVRMGDMLPPADSVLRVLFDADNDVCLEIWENDRGSANRACIEFCTGIGGGRSPRTREALIALMCAIEDDNATMPHPIAQSARG